MIKILLKEINDVILKLVSEGLTINQNYSVINNKILHWNYFKNNSQVLKNLPYNEIYDIIDKENNYSIKFIDGSISQLYYEMSEDYSRIIAHRLSYYPSPENIPYAENRILYDEDQFKDFEKFLSKPRKGIAPIIRLDFDANLEINSPIVHPVTHLTLGNMSNSRIPIKSPITPKLFISFILINIFGINPNFSRTSNENELLKTCQDTIFPEEKQLLHINFIPKI